MAHTSSPHTGQPAGSPGLPAIEGRLRPPTIRYHAAEHQGHRRQWHCDATAVAGTEHATSLVVADGVGDEPEAAHAAGLAAHTAAAAAAVSASSRVGFHAARAALDAAYEGAPPGQDGDCALVVAVVASRTLQVAWAGDARAYRLAPAGRLHQLTSDHTLAAQQLARGLPAEFIPASWHDALAVTARKGAAEFVVVDVTEPQRLLVCSDGLSKAIEETALAELLAGGTPEQAAADLTAAALAVGGRDNVALVVADHLATAVTP